MLRELCIAQKHCCSSAAGIENGLRHWIAAELSISYQPIEFEVVKPCYQSPRATVNGVGAFDGSGTAQSSDKFEKEERRTI